MSTPAVFLDRDGTVNTEEDYLSRVESVRLEKNAAEGLKLLQNAGFLLVVVTNQSGVARGLFDEAAVAAVNERLADILAENGVKIDAFYYCPHHPEGTMAQYARECNCRKPASGMFRAAARDLDIDLAASYTVGDRARDLQAGRNVGTGTVLVRTGYGLNTVKELDPSQSPDYVADDLKSAAAWILNDARKRVRP